ncbi:MAG: hypothetical protein IJ571_03595 [Ruminococcus sp.]|nr:hypothetical protein [Ruminococcus sp.]
MLNIVIAVVSVLIPIGMMIFYFFINRSLNEPVEKENNSIPEDSKKK